MDAKTLNRQADKLHGDANQKRQVASRMMQDASGHHDIGLDTKAEVEEQQAASYQSDAEALDEQADQLEARAAANMAQARGLDDREAELRKDFERQLKEIDAERRRLLG